MKATQKVTQDEEWLPVPGYDGLYEVSNFGSVRSYHNFGFGRKKEAKRLKPTKNRSGYFELTLCKNGVHEQISVHKIVARTFLPPNPGGLQIDHINGVKTDNRVVNLEWVTPQENTLRSVATGLKPTGERHFRHKLTQSKVDKIRKLYKTGQYTHRQLGEMFGISHCVVGKVIRNEAWRVNDGQDHTKRESS